MANPLLDLVQGETQTDASPNQLLALVNPIGVGGSSPEMPAASPSATQAKPITKGSKILKGVTDQIEGAAQLLTHVLPSGVVESGNALNNWLADKTGMVAKIPEGGMDALVANNERTYQAGRAAAGESGFDGYRMLGNVLSPANLALATKLPQAATFAGRIGVGALGGGASAISNPVTEGNFWREKGKQAVMGSAAGAVVPAVTGAVARIVSPRASANPQLNLLQSEGVQPTIGQSLGGAANSLEEKAQSLPLVGDAIASARGRARDQFNNAAINRATGEIGVTVKGSGTDAVREAGDQIGKVYEAGKAALGGFSIDQQASSELASLRNMVQTGLPGRERSTVENYFNNYLNRPALTAQSFKELDSKLTSDIAKFGSGDAYQQKVADALSEAQRIITDNAKRANPKAAQMLDAADRAWANLVRVEGAATAAKSTEGVFTPGQLMTAVRGADKSVRDRATARGTALMQDLATAGQNVLGNKVPDSGTAGRLLWGAGGAAMMAAPVPTIAGVAGGLAMYSPQGQALLRALATSRPNAAKPIADAIRQVSPYLIPAGAQVGLGLLN